LLPAGLLLAACQKPTPTHFTDGGQDVPADKGHTYQWKFDDLAAGAIPGDFIEVLGDWSVAAEGTATSAPNVLRQKGSYGDPDFPRILVKSLSFTDPTVRVRCRPESGSSDQACGLIFRLRDSDNYYITRANALEGNVNLYRVVSGDRQQFASGTRSRSAPPAPRSP